MAATSGQVQLRSPLRLGGWRALIAAIVVAASVIAGILVGRATAEPTPASGAVVSTISFETGPQRTMADRIHGENG